MKQYNDPAWEVLSMIDITSIRVVRKSILSYILSYYVIII